MASFKERERQASELRKAGEYEKALSIYRELWKENRGKFNKWAMWNYAKSAQKCGAHDEASEVARIMYDEHPGFDVGKQLLAWCHYYQFFRDDPAGGQPSREYWDAAHEVVELCEEDPYSKYAPYVRIVFSIISQLEDQQATGKVVENRLKWLNRLDPQQLGSEAEVYRGNSGQRREQASNLERWYSHMSKALFDAERYEDCIDICQEGLERISSLHYDNDIWFAYRIAKSESELGRTKKALDRLKEIVLEKPEWHIYYQVALHSYKLDVHEDALRYGSEAASAPGPLSFKWKLFLLLATVLRSLNKPNLAERHAALSSAIRHEEGWNVKGRALELFRSFGVEEGGEQEAKKIEQELSKQWKKWSTEMLPAREGSIDWVHHEKPFGFIETDNSSDSIFFRTADFEGTDGLCSGGTRVQFHIKESYDSKKGEMSERAIQVVPLEQAEGDEAATISDETAVSSSREVAQGEAKSNDFFSDLEEGKVMQGVVTNVVDFGAFVDLGGVDGLLHVTEMRWGRTSDPAEIVEKGQELEVMVLDFEAERERVSLGLKQLSENPWSSLEEGDYAQGDVVEGKVVSITDYGAFMELQPGIEGLVHESELSRARDFEHPSEVVSVGDMVEAQVLSTNINERKIALSLKELEPSPWEGISNRYSIGETVTGTARNLVDFGCFIEVEPGVHGLLHVSDMPEGLNHPKEFVQEDEELDVVVLDIDEERERLSLRCKQ